VNYVIKLQNYVTIFQQFVLTFIKTKNENKMNSTAILNRTNIKKRIMGQSRPIICNECGNHWTHIDGSGFRSAIYYCDLCANRKSLFQDRMNKLAFLNPENLKKCECGGSFAMKTTIRCPECQSTDLEIISQSTPWD